MQLKFSNLNIIDENSNEFYLIKVYEQKYDDEGIENS